jgi:hypothetical protein
MVKMETVEIWYGKSLRSLFRGEHFSDLYDRLRLRIELAYGVKIRPFILGEDAALGRRGWEIWIGSQRTEADGGVWYAYIFRNRRVAFRKGGTEKFVGGRQLYSGELPAQAEQAFRLVEQIVTTELESEAARITPRSDPNSTVVIEA